MYFTNDINPVVQEDFKILCTIKYSRILKYKLCLKHVGKGAKFHSSIRRKSEEKSVNYRCIY